MATEEKHVLQRDEPPLRCSSGWCCQCAKSCKMLLGEEKQHTAYLTAQYHKMEKKKDEAIRNLGDLSAKWQAKEHQYETLRKQNEQLLEENAAQASKLAAIQDHPNVVQGGTYMSGLPSFAAVLDGSPCTGEVYRKESRSMQQRYHPYESEKQKQTRRQFTPLPPPPSRNQSPPPPPPSRNGSPPLGDFRVPPRETEGAWWTF